MRIKQNQMNIPLDKTTYNKLIANKLVIKMPACFPLQGDLYFSNKNSAPCVYSMDISSFD